VKSGNRVFVILVGALGALAAADAGHEDEDGYQSNWLVAEADCSSVDSWLANPARLATPASVEFGSLRWNQDCESR
jgi:hypothetical protein